MTDDIKDKSHLFKPGQSGNKSGRPVGTITSDKINDEDRAYYGTDSRKFLERALLRARNWEEGLKYAKELRLLQHPSLQSIQTRSDTVHTITLRWSKPEEIPSNEKTSLVELTQGTGYKEIYSNERTSIEATEIKEGEEEGT